MRKPEVEQLIQNFKTTAVRHGQAADQGNRQSGIDLTKKCLRYGKELLYSGGAGIDALCRMCTDDDAHVRYISACMLMDTMPRLAEETLRGLTNVPGNTGKRASAALDIWEEGYWPL